MNEKHNAHQAGSRNAFSEAATIQDRLAAFETFHRYPANTELSGREGQVSMPEQKEIV